MFENLFNEMFSEFYNLFNGLSSETPKQSKKTIKYITTLEQGSKKVEEMRQKGANIEVKNFTNVTISDGTTTYEIFYEIPEGQLPPTSHQNEATKRDIKLSQLKKKMEIAIDNEDFELAANLRDEIKAIKEIK